MKHFYFTLILPLFFSTYTQGQQLLEVIDLGKKSKEELVQEFSLLAQYGAQAYKIIYSTTDVKGQPTQASGLVTVPDLEGFAFPLICYQHGTVWEKEAIPSNLSEETDAAWLLASNGYVAVLPDYLGFGASTGIHPYLHADSEASVAIDMLYAARELAQDMEFALNDQLFVTGYSQGGHAAAALHRKLQEDYANEFNVVASAPMSGAYDISGVSRRVIIGEEPYFFPAFLVNALISYNYVYDLYADLGEIFKMPYDTMVKNFVGDSISMTEMNEQMIQQLELDHDSVIVKKMLQDSIVSILTEADPAHPLMQALIDNDVYDWSPQVPTRFFYCSGDDRVSPENSLIAETTMQDKGAPDVMAIDMDPTADHIECIPSAVVNGLLFFGPFKQLVTSQEPLLSMNTVKVYPNPVRDHLRLEGIPTGSHIQLYNANGQLLKMITAQNETMQIDLSKQRSGFFILRITDGKRSWSRKIIR
jgi:pimeloyl-ACP methyl ester carboxylesterase